MTAKARNVGGRPEHRPSLKDRRVVTLLAGVGISQDQIAAALGFARKTLAKHYHEELRDGSAKVEAELVQNLVRLASGDGRDRVEGEHFPAADAVPLERCTRRRGRRSRSARRNRRSATPRTGSTRTIEWSDLLLQ